MRTTAKHLAQRIGADERTVRRAVQQGALRVSRASARRIDVSEAEERYLREHWPQLQRLRALLRTEPNVRLAVLFGSFAHGRTHPDSDIDLLVVLRNDGWEQYRLARRLERATDRSVDLAVLDGVRRSNPGLLATVLREGRVLVDRDHRWEPLRREEPALRREAAERDRRETAEVRAMLEELIGT